MLWRKKKLMKKASKIFKMYVPCIPWCFLTIHVGVQGAVKVFLMLD